MKSDPISLTNPFSIRVSRKSGLDPHSMNNFINGRGKMLDQKSKIDSLPPEIRKALRKTQWKRTQNKDLKVFKKVVADTLRVPGRMAKIASKALKRQMEKFADKASDTLQGKGKIDSLPPEIRDALRKT